MAQDYRATVAAIRTYYGKRLRLPDYRDLLNLHSLPEIVAYLKETDGYGELLRGLDPAFTHRGYLEMLLQRSPFIACLHFCKLEQMQKVPFITNTSTERISRWVSSPVVLDTTMSWSVIPRDVLSLS